jgi:hypothetical protein
VPTGAMLCRSVRRVSAASDREAFERFFQFLFADDSPNNDRDCERYCDVSIPLEKSRSPAPWALAEVEISVVREAGKRELVVAGQVEAELAQAEIRAGQCTAIQNPPTFTVLD